MMDNFTLSRKTSHKMQALKFNTAQKFSFLTSFYINFVLLNVFNNKNFFHFVVFPFCLCEKNLFFFIFRLFAFILKNPRRNVSKLISLKSLNPVLWKYSESHCLLKVRTSELIAVMEMIFVACQQLLL